MNFGFLETFQKKRHKGDLRRFHPFEGLSVRFVVKRWILKEFINQLKNNVVLNMVLFRFTCICSHCDELQLRKKLLELAGTFLKEKISQRWSENPNCDFKETHKKTSSPPMFGLVC